MNKIRFTSLTASLVLATTLTLSCGNKGDKDKFTDSRDGKTYKTVTIGTQTWMAENLNYAPGGECLGGNEKNCEKYGRLYTWDAAKEAVPQGWHLPSIDEWKTLVNFAGGFSEAGKKLKAKTGWGEESGGTDDYGFAALPGGAGATGGLSHYFGSMGVDGGVWWTSSVSQEGEEGGGDDEAFFIQMFYQDNENFGNNVGYGYDTKVVAFSVRLVKDDTASTAEAQSPPAETSVDSVKIFDKTCLIDIPDFEYLKAKAERNAAEEAEGNFDETGDDAFYMGNAIGQFNKLGFEGSCGYVEEKDRYLSFALDDGENYVIDLKDGERREVLLYKKGKKPLDIGIGWENPIGMYLQEISTYLGMKASEVMKKAEITQGSFKDSRNGLYYQFVLIGEQIWMAKNLDYYAPGTFALCPDGSGSNCEKYGWLYNWEAAKKAVPQGWRLPTVKDWEKLENAVGGKAVAGKKLKSKDGWNENGNGSDDYGFSALPGGMAFGEGEYASVGKFGFWWSATNDGEDVYVMKMDYMMEATETIGNPKTNLFSVRCVWDE
jgi:uncharacterized protein (TIGR02145 family)